MTINLAKMDREDDKALVARFGGNLVIARRRQAIYMAVLDALPLALVTDEARAMAFLAMDG